MKQLNNNTFGENFWKKFLELPLGKIMLFKEHPGKNT